MFSGAFYDRGHLKLVLGTGLSLVVLGLMLLSVSRSYWQILLTQGICVGFGSGLLYVPAVAVVSNQFTTKRAVALGVAATGTAVGGVVLPITFRQLLPSIDFGWTNRALGFLVLLLSVLAYLLLTDIHCCSPCRSDHRRQRKPSILESQQTTDNSKCCSLDRRHGARPHRLSLHSPARSSLPLPVHGRLLCVPRILGSALLHCALRYPFTRYLPCSSLVLTCDPQRRQLLRSHNASISEPDCRNCTRAFCWCHFIGCHRIRVARDWKFGGHHSVVFPGWVRFDGACPTPSDRDWSWYLSHSMMV